MKSDPLFTLSNPNIIVTRIEPAKSGFRIRIFNAGGAPETFRINWEALQPSKISVSRKYGEFMEMNPVRELDIEAFGIIEMEVE